MLRTSKFSQFRGVLIKKECTIPGGVLDFRMVTHDETGNSPTHPLPEEENQNFDPCSKKMNALPTHF